MKNGAIGREENPERRIRLTPLGLVFKIPGKQGETGTTHKFPRDPNTEIKREIRSGPHKRGRIRKTKGWDSLYKKIKRRLKEGSTG